MAVLAVNPDLTEVIFDNMPKRQIEKFKVTLRKKSGICEEIMISEYWGYLNSVEGETFMQTGIELPQGTIKKICGHELTWEDDPLEI